MEAIVALAVLVLFAALAARFGHDSRDGIHTKEYDLAAAGMTWSRSDDSSPRPSRTDVRRATADRRRRYTTQRGNATSRYNVRDGQMLGVLGQIRGECDVGCERREEVEITMHISPILALIDQALGADRPGFATSMHAASLESYARELADEYWSEHVWLTGRITSAAFRCVSEPLALR